jgi:hypothetical protein
MTAALAGGESYTYGSQIQFFTPSSVVGQPTTPWMPVTEGQIQISSSASAPRTMTRCRFETIDADSGATVAGLVPVAARGPISPFGTECSVRSGLIYGDGTADWVIVGTFVVEQIGQYAPGYVELGKCADRSSRYSRILTYTIQTGQNDNYIDVITRLLQACQYSIWPFEITAPWFSSSGEPWPFQPAFWGPGAVDNDYDLPSMTFTTGDVPWDQATAVAAAVGQILTINPAGIVTTQRVIDTQAGPPTWTFQAGQNATFEGMTRLLSQKQGQDVAINHAIVLGTSIDGSAPVRADSFDLDPSSPTYWTGRGVGYGDMAGLLNASQYINDAAAAKAAADAYLAANRGAIETVSFTTTPNPLLDAWDLISATSGQTGAQALYQIGEMTLPLSPGKMAVTSRNRRLTV